MGLGDELGLNVGIRALSRAATNHAIGKRAHPAFAEWMMLTMDSGDVYALAHVIVDADEAGLVKASRLGQSGEAVIEVQL